MSSNDELRLEGKSDNMSLFLHEVVYISAGGHELLFMMSAEKN